MSARRAANDFRSIAWLVVLSQLAACGGGGSTGGGSPTPATAQAVSAKGPNFVTIDPSGKFAYVTNEFSANVSAFTINANTGDLSAVAGSPIAAGTTPFSVMVHPSGKFAYVANYGSNNVSVFTIDAATGVLTEIAGSPFASAQNPYSLAIHPSGRFAYVVSGNASVFAPSTVSAFTIDATTGALTAVVGSPFAVGSNPSSVAVDPSGRFVYVANFYDRTVSAFTIDDVSGALAAIAGSPFATEPGAGDPRSIAIDPFGRFAYIANEAFTNSSGSVSAFIIDANTGALTAVVGSPFTAGIDTPLSVTVDPLGRFVYVANSDSDSVAAFTISATTGALTAVARSPFHILAENFPFPVTVTVDPLGKFVYVAVSGSDVVSAFAIDAVSGALRSTPGSPFPVGQSP